MGVACGTEPKEKGDAASRETSMEKTRSFLSARRASWLKRARGADLEVMDAHRSSDTTPFPRVARLFVVPVHRQSAANEDPALVTSY